MAIYNLLWTRRINIFNMPKWNFSFISVTIHPSRWPLRPTLPSLPFPLSSFIYIYIYILPPDFSCLFIGNRDMAYKRVHPLRRGGECKPWKHAVGSACLTGKDVRNPSNQGEDPRIRSRSRNFVNGNRRYIELSCNLYFHFGFDPW